MGKTQKTKGAKSSIDNRVITTGSVQWLASGEGKLETRKKAIDVLVP